MRYFLQWLEDNGTGVVLSIVLLFFMLLLFWAATSVSNKRHEYSNCVIEMLKNKTTLEEAERICMSLKDNK